MAYSLTGLSTDQQLLLDEGKLLPLMEEFYTVQGEGFNTGKAAYFIRLGGCDVGCHWCDVKESWDASLHPLTDADSIVAHAKQHPAKAVVVTGGEPLQYNLNFLTASLKKNGFSTFIETSGTYAVSGQWDWLCLSPKKTMETLADIFPLADELKIIVHNKNDLKWAEENAARVSAQCHLFLQPEWSKRNQIMPLVVDYVMKHPKWMISLQTHKYLNIP
jgi:organic radical activating enzyme